MNKTIQIVLAVAVAIGVLAWKHWRGEAAGPAAAQGGFVIPPDATAFRAGTLDFKRCEIKRSDSAATTSAFCAPFQVPENWDTPDSGRKIDLRVALIASTAAMAERDLVVLLAGGPGQAAVDVWPQIAGAFAPLLKHRHVLLLDQRGTGGSNALTCKLEADAEQEFNIDNATARTRTCLAEVSTHADPRYYTTGMALRDLEALRQALAAPQLNLVGVSYGTRVAQQYVHAYPDAVRSVVLDSAVPNEEILGAEFAINLDASLKAQFDLCKATPACAKAFGDPWASLHALREALTEKPEQVTYRDPKAGSSKSMRLDRYTLAMLARIYAYSPETSALLPLSIANALQGDRTPLASQVQMLSGQLEGLSDNMMQLSVLCSEDADLLAPRPQDAETLLGPVLVDVFRAQCAIWPRGTRSADFHAPLASDKPVLILAGEFDPVTPPRYGEHILKTLPNARLLVAKGQGHSVMGRGCFPKLVGTFVEKLDPKALDAGCLADFGPTPAFLNFNGAAP